MDNDIYVIMETIGVNMTTVVGVYKKKEKADRYLQEWANIYKPYSIDKIGGVYYTSDGIKRWIISMNLIE